MFKKGSVVILFLAVSILGISVAGAATAPAPMPVTTTTHDNIVTFSRVTGDSVSYVGFEASFNKDDYNVTAGQPWNWVAVSNSSGNFTVTLNLRAGRHNSNGPAVWFRNSIPTKLILLATWPASGDVHTMPANLNFAFRGILDIDKNKYPIIVGEGSSGIHNDWWVGGAENGWTVKYVGLAVPLLVTPDGKYGISTEDDTFNSFRIEAMK